MDAIVKFVSFYENESVEMTVVCKKCSQINYHSIGRAVSKSEGETTIDFSKLGNMKCENKNCDNTYGLFKITSTSLSC